MSNEILKQEDKLENIQQAVRKIHNDLKTSITKSIESTIQGIASKINIVEESDKTRRTKTTKHSNGIGHPGNPDHSKRPNNPSNNRIRETNKATNRSSTA